MKMRIVVWLPAAILSLGAIGTLGAGTQQGVPLRAPLDPTIPSVIVGHQAEDVEISEDEQRVAGMDEFVMRSYTPLSAGAAAAAGFTVYVGYYEQQYRGHTIHSPKNCLPGSGWEALTSTTAVVATALGPVTVNQYLLKRGDSQALVLYWYQGRGRIEHNEYTVKWDLLRDAAFRRRSDEALVRIVVPVTEDEAAALKTGSEVAARLIPAVYEALPL